MQSLLPELVNLITVELDLASKVSLKLALPKQIVTLNPCRFCPYNIAIGCAAAHGYVDILNEVLNYPTVLRGFV